MSDTTDTDCRKCGWAMTPLRQTQATTPMEGMVNGMTITGYRCKVCGHWNDLKRRGKRAKK